MYKGIRYLLVVLALLLAPLPLAGQQPDGPDRGPQSSRRMMFEDMDGPVQIILRNRVVLSLTTDQVTRLEEIDRQLTQRVRPLIMQMVEIRRQIPRRVRESEMSPEQLEAYRARLRSAQTLLEQIQSNNHVAMMDVREILSDTQKTRLLELLKSERDDDGGRDPRRRSDDRRN